MSHSSAACRHSILPRHLHPSVLVRPLQLTVISWVFIGITCRYDAGKVRKADILADTPDKLAEKKRKLMGGSSSGAAEGSSSSSEVMATVTEHGSPLPMRITRSKGKASTSAVTLEASE